MRYGKRYGLHRKRISPETIQELIRKGYRRTSNAHGMVSRVDRPDWKERLKEMYPHSPGVLNPDFYRRCVSQDTLELHNDDAQKIPNSNHDMTGYVDA